MKILLSKQKGWGIWVECHDGRTGWYSYQPTLSAVFYKTRSEARFQVWAIAQTKSAESIRKIHVVSVKIPQYSVVCREVKYHGKVIA